LSILYMSFLTKDACCDVGSGPGSWRVAVSGSSTHWTYEGDGQCKISVESDGTYTISGGSNTVNGSV
jgi:hypothetical protein